MPRASSTCPRPDSDAPLVSAPTTLLYCFQPASLSYSAGAVEGECEKGCSSMAGPWLTFVIIAALALLIPLAVLIGQRTPGGPIVVASGGALLAFAGYWVMIGILSASPVDEQRPPDLLPSSLVLTAGIVLLVAAWTLALADAAQGRRWGWVALLSLGFYANVAAAYWLGSSSFLSCLLAGPQSFCPPYNHFTAMLIIAGSFVGPGVALTYALRAPTAGKRTLPDGLSVSPLGATDADAIDQIEIERL